MVKARWFVGMWLAVALQAQPANTWLYVNSFHSGVLYVWDVGAGKMVHQIPVEDRSGAIGAAISRDGKKLFVVDGNQGSRLRIFDAGSAQATAEHAFQNRVLLHGSGSILDLTPDDRFLFLHTYDYASAASGVRVFDATENAFLALGMRSRQCAAPLLVGARDGTVFSVCPRMLYELNPLGTNPPEFLAGKRASTAIEEAAGAVASPDGSHLFVIEDARGQEPWNLVRWDGGAAQAQTVNLRRALGTGAGDFHAWMAISPDGKTLALLYGAKLWLLEAAGLKPVRHVDLPGEAAGLAFDSGGTRILTMRESTVLLAPVAGGKVESQSLTGVKLQAGPTVFLTAQAAQ